MENTDKLFELVLILVGFYVLYAIQNVFYSTFYCLGKTNYMLYESVVTNTIYYGIAFILYLVCFGVGYLAKIGTLGTVKATEVWNDETGVYDKISGDNSFLILLDVNLKELAGME